LGALAIVLFFVGLLAIILIHEFGHYLAGRAFGFRILEYFVGFGPKLWSFRRGDIEYGIKAIPAGGYVKIAGMNPFVNDVPPGDESRAYFSKPIWQRAVVILAGPASHFIVGGLIFAALLMTTGDLSSKTVVGDITPTIGHKPSPAAAAGLQPGDLIVRVGDVQNPTPEQLGTSMRDHIGEPVTFSVERDGRVFDVTMTPVVDVIRGEQVPRIGVLLDPVPRPFFSAIVGGYEDVWHAITESVQQIGHVFGPQGIERTFHLLFTDAPRQPTDATSVVGVGQQVGAIGSRGDWVLVVYAFAYLTVFIGLINLVPLPPFDGGHLAVLLIEKIRGKAVDMRKLVPVSAVVMGFLILFVFATVVLDIGKPIPIEP
jgi:membrane-associated protease RseP (regulator of RpoE activity)